MSAKALNCILLVDDDAVTNLMHKRLIARGGLARRVDVVTDGVAALEYLNACNQQQQGVPELVLLDINMPRMSGFEFLDEYTNLPAALRNEQRVLMLSTSMLSSDKARAARNSCVAGYESKPLRATDIERIVSDCHTARGGSD